MRRTLRMGQSPPRAGIADAHLRSPARRRSNIPPRPHVKQPVSWSIAVQDIVHDAYTEAAESLGVWPWDRRWGSSG